jgi:hypothetical protein
VAGVDQLLGGRRHLGEDPEPAERVLALEDAQGVLDRRARDAVEAVAAGDHVAAERVPRALVGEGDRRAVGLEVRDRDVLDLEAGQRAGRLARGEEILDHLLLAVDRDPAAAGQLGEVDPVPAAAEAQLDPVMDEPLAPHPLAQPARVEEVRRALLEHPGADPLLEVRAAAGLHHDGVDAVPPEEMREQQPGRPGAHDADLRLHVRHESASYGDRS